MIIERMPRMAVTQVIQRIINDTRIFLTHLLVLITGF